MFNDIKTINTKLQWQLGQPPLHLRRQRHHPRPHQPRPLQLHLVKQDYSQAPAKTASGKPAPEPEEFSIKADDSKAARIRDEKGLKVWFFSISLI